MALREPTSGARGRRGFIGLYSLGLMAKGPVYAFQVVVRIAERTEGRWHPSPGAVYPTLRSLVAEGLATSARVNGRIVYEITARGRARLAEARPRLAAWGSRFASSWRLLLDLISPEEAAELLANRLHTDLRVLEAVVEGSEGGLDEAGRRAFAREIVAELRRSQRRLLRSLA